MPLNPAWGAIAKEDPDARAKRSRNEKKSVLLGWMGECFCVNCGKPPGMISNDSGAYVFCLCHDCVFTHGKPPGVDQVPDARVHRRMARLKGISIHNDTAQPIVVHVGRRGQSVPLLTLPIAAAGWADWPMSLEEPFMFVQREDLVIHAP